mmetsp:Transcript_16747/g.31084  ORF Transcript_16747/g.31084 Transcript_16747/m.31084 type:complete len:94 (+) Transcript_16747:26-307(+)
MHSCTVCMCRITFHKGLSPLFVLIPEANLMMSKLDQNAQSHTSDSQPMITSLSPRILDLIQKNRKSDRISKFNVSDAICMPRLSGERYGYTHV